MNNYACWKSFALRKNAFPYTMLTQRSILGTLVMFQPHQKLAATKSEKQNAPSNNRFNDAPLEKDKRNTSYFLIIFAVSNRQTNPQKPNVIQLLRFKHFRKNITEKLKLVEAYEGNIKRIVYDIFGVQVGTLN